MYLLLSMKTIPKDIQALLKKSGISEGMTIVEFGTGKRMQIVLAAANLVGESGHVYAVDAVVDDLLDVQKQAAMRGVHQVGTIHADFESARGTHLDDGSVDIVICVHNVWRIQDFDAMLGEAGRILKQGGKILLLDWQNETKDPIAPHAMQRLDFVEAQRICAKSGCRKIEQAVNTHNNWGLILHF